MRLNGKSISGWVMTLSLLVGSGILLHSPKTVWAHGAELGNENKGGSQNIEARGPYGGQLIEFENNHLEFTVDHESGEITLFLLDGDLKAVPMPKGYSGVIYITLANGSKKTLTLARGTEGPVFHLEAETGTKDIGPFKAVISLKNGEKRRNFRFDWAPAVHEHKE